MKEIVDPNKSILFHISKIHSFLLYQVFYIYIYTLRGSRILFRIRRLRVIMNYDTNENIN